MITFWGLLKQGTTIPVLSKNITKMAIFAHELNLKSFWAKLLLLKCYESAIEWLYPKNVSSSVQVLKQVDKSG